MFPFLLLLLALFFLGKSADLVVHSLVAIGKRLRLSDFVIGFFVLGLATSLPELLVAINAVADNVPQLSFGNLIGASFVLFSLIAGFTALTNNGIRIKSQYARRELLVVGLLLLLPILVALDGELTKLDGLILILAYSGYVLFAFFQKALVTLNGITASGFTMLRIFLYFIFGTIGIFLFSNYAVESAIAIADRLRFPLLLTGLLILGVGTNLPELTLGFRANKNKHKDIVLGDIFGSAAANTLIVGFVAFVQPFALESVRPIIISGVFLLVALLLFAKFAKTNRTLSAKEGLLLLALYGLFLLTEVIGRGLS